MQSKLNKLKHKLQGGQSKVTINTEIYFLAKELGCLPDLLGREYRFVYEEGKIVGFKQLPMAIPAFISMMNEMEKDYKNQQKQMKIKGKGRR